MLSLKFLSLLLMSSPLPGRLTLQAGASRPLLVPRVGHQQAIFGIDVSPDDKFIVTGSKDDTVRLWSIAKREEVRCYAGHKRQVNAAAFVDEGKRVMTGGEDTRLYGWDPVDYSPEAKRTEPYDADSPIVSVRYAAKSASTVVVTKSHEICLLGPSGLIADRFPRRPTLEMGGLKVSDFKAVDGCVSEDGSKIWVAYQNEKHPEEPGYIDLFDIRNPDNKLRYTYPNIQSIDFQQGHLLVATGSKLVDIDPDKGTGSSPRGVVRWQVEVGEPIAEVRVSKSTPVRIAVCTSTGEGAKNGIAGYLKVFSGDGALVKQVETKEKPHCVAWSHSGEFFVAGVDERATFVSMSSNEVANFDGLGAAVHQVAFSPNADLQLVQWGRNTLKLWSSSTGDCSNLVASGPGITVSAMAPAGNYVAAGLDTNPPSALLVNVASREKKSLASGSKVNFVAFDRDGSRMFACSKDGTFGVWDTLTGETIKSEMRLEPDWIMLSLSTDGKSLLALYDNDLVCSYAVDTGRPIKRAYVVEGSKKSLNYIAMDPTGARFFASSNNDPGGLYDSRSLKRLVSLSPNDPERVKTAAFSPDGNYLFCGCQDRSVRVFDTRTGKRISEMDGHESWLSSIAVARRGDRLLAVTGSLDGSTMLWNVTDPANPVSLCKLLCFDKGEWAVVDRDSRFDASQVGKTDGLHWVLEGDVYELIQAKNGYYEEGLLAKILAAAQLPAPQMTWLRAPMPDISVSATSTKIRIRLLDRGAGSGRVEVLVNGSIILTLASDDPSRESFDLDLLDTKVQERLLPQARSNFVTVRAYNASNTLWLSQSREIAPAAGTPLSTVIPDGKPRLYALVVGVNQGSSDEVRLDFAAEGARKFGQVIGHVASAKYGPNNVDLQVFSDEESPDSGSYASCKRLVETLKRISAKARPQDAIVVYLSGHASTNSGGDYQFLTPTDTKPGSTPLTGAEIANALSAAKATYKALILDTCWAASIGGKGRLNDLSDNANVVILAGCGVGESSWEVIPLQSGLLTYALMQPLANREVELFQKDSAGRIILRTEAWFRYAQEHVPELVARWIPGTNQTPFIGLPGSGPNAQGPAFVVGYYQPPIPVTVSQPTGVYMAARVYIRGTDKDPQDMTGMLRSRLREGTRRKSQAPYYVSDYGGPNEFSVRADYTVTTSGLTLNVAVTDPKGTPTSQAFTSTLTNEDVEKMMDRIVDWVQSRLSSSKS